MLPREMVKWIQTLDLSVVIKNPRRFVQFYKRSLSLFITLFFPFLYVNTKFYRDFANGFVIAEILSRYFPNEINTRSFDTGTSHAAKTQNWEYLNSYLKKKDIAITPKMIDDTMNYRTEGTQDLLDTIYTFLTRRPAPPRPKVVNAKTVPFYAQPTTNELIKEHEKIFKKQDLTQTAKEVFLFHSYLQFPLSSSFNYFLNIFIRHNKSYSSI